MARARIGMPAKAKPGEIVDIKTLIQHPMETGYRRDDLGAPVARDIIEQLIVTYAGEQVFRAEMGPGVAANPFIQFSTVATATGDLEFKWIGMKGEILALERRTLTVEG